MPPSQWMSTNRRLPGIDNRLHRIRKQAFGHRPRGNSRHEAVHATEFGSRNSATGQNSAAAIGQGAHDGHGLSVDAAAQRHRGRMMRAKKSKQAIHSSPQQSTAVHSSPRMPPSASISVRPEALASAPLAVWPEALVPSANLLPAVVFGHRPRGSSHRPSAKGLTTATG